MLKPDDLKTAIKSALTSIYKPAVEELVLGLLSDKTTAGDEMAKDIAERFDASTSDQMAELLSSAIDYYVKNISVTGTLITTGSPFVHTVSIAAAPTPITAGKIPNTLGIS